MKEPRQINGFGFDFPYRDPYAKEKALLCPYYRLGRRCQREGFPPDKGMKIKGGKKRVCGSIPYAFLLRSFGFHANLYLNRNKFHEFLQEELKPGIQGNRTCSNSEIHFEGPAI